MKYNYELKNKYVLILDEEGSVKLTVNVHIAEDWPYFHIGEVNTPKYKVLVGEFDDEETGIFAANRSELDTFATRITQMFNGSFSAVCDLVFASYGCWRTKGNADDYTDNDLRLDATDGDVGSDVQFEQEVLEYYAYEDEDNDNYSNEDDQPTGDGLTIYGQEITPELKRDISKYLRHIMKIKSDIDSIELLDDLRDIFANYINKNLLESDFETSPNIPHFFLQAEFGEDLEKNGAALERKRYS